MNQEVPGTHPTLLTRLPRKSHASLLTLPELAHVVPPDGQARQAIRTGTHGVDTHAAGRRFGNVDGCLVPSNGTGGHHEVHVLPGLDAIFGDEVHLGPANDLAQVAIDD